MERGEKDGVHACKNSILELLKRAHCYNVCIYRKGPLPNPKQHRTGWQRNYALLKF